MVRSAPGAGDRGLLAELARRDRGDITAYQLERWRGAGLLERTVIDCPGGGGSSSALAAPVARVADQVEVVAARAWPGRPLEVTAVAVSADGFDVSEAALRAGHARNLVDVNAMLERTVDRALAAWPGSRPRTGLDKATAVADWLLRQPGPRTLWRRNLARAGDLTVGSTVEKVLGSGVTAAMQLILTGRASDGGLYEFVTAMGLREFLDAMVGASNSRARDVDESALLVAPLVRTPATAGPGVSKLTSTLDAPIEQLRAAGVLAVALWAVLERIPALAPALRRLPAPTGDNPRMYTLAVAMLLRATAAEGIDVAPVVEFSTSVGLMTDREAQAMTEAGAVLADAYNLR